MARKANPVSISFTKEELMAGIKMAEFEVVGSAEHIHYALMQPKEGKISTNDLRGYRDAIDYYVKVRGAYERKFGEIKDADMIPQPSKLVRRDDPATSHDAAESIDATAMESVVADAIWEFGAAGAIADQVCNALPHHRYNSVTPRFKALKEKGIIITDGTKRKGASGRSQMVMWHKEFYHAQ